MKAEFKIASQSYFVDLSKPEDISIPLRFNDEQPNSYDVPKAASRPYEDQNFIGDTRRGGSCNFEEYRLIPHCNGTHTECVGHISFDRISVHTTLMESVIPATLVSIQPVNAPDTNETYRPPKNAADILITQENLEQALHGRDSRFLRGLILRTLPNDPSKIRRRYTQMPHPYFSVEAMRYVTELGVHHLLVDTPSVDRMFDEGKLTAHHIFWDVPEGSHDVSTETCSIKTITEMIYVANEIEDGPYLLNLQIASFVADAAPSRPLLYRVSLRS